MEKKIIVIIVLALIIVFLMGTMAGVYITSKVVASIAVGFIDPELVEKAIGQYEDRIKKCYPSKV